MIYFVVTEEEKFRADTFRILGVALITPIARILLDPYAYFTEHNIIYSIFYLIFALGFAYAGLLHIERARVILDERSNKEWKSQR